MTFFVRALSTILVAVLVALVLLTAIDPSTTVALTSTPIADARINRLAPTSNYGTISTLRADADDYESLIRFNASPSGVTNARLRVYVTDPGASLSVYATTTAWAESSVTWNSAPPAGALAGSFPPGVTGQWIEADVTSAVASGTVAFRIRSTSSDGVSFGSRENTNKPQLIVTSATTTPPLSPSPTIAPTPTPAGSDPVILAAGDIATSGSGDTATALILDGQPGTVLTLGDHAYSDGSLSQFQTYYDPTWGRQKLRTRPAMGNHDYGCCPAASGARSYFGLAPGPLYYSYDLGTWHIIALDAGICYSRQTAACNAGSAQEQWLKADLAAHPSACTLLYWHQARWSSGSTHGSDGRMQAFWADAVAARADIVLSSHDHDYERLAPMNAAGASDPNGVREFVVGTGGASVYSFGTPLATSQVRYNGGFGVLRLTLRSGTYDWQFLSVAGKTFTDSGTGVCH